MLQPRVGPASSNYGRFKWIVTGGSLKNGIILKTTEIYDDTTEKWTEGPLLPWPLTYHCQVQIGMEVVIIGEIMQLNFLNRINMGGVGKVLQCR